MNESANIHACVALIFEQQGQILLQLRSKCRQFYPDCYALPAGRVERAESIIEAAIREADEELGVKLLAKDLQVLHCCYQRRSANDFSLVFYLKVAAWQGTITNLEPQKHPEMRWVSWSELPENLAPHHRQALEKISVQQFYDETLNSTD